MHTVFDLVGKFCVVSRQAAGQQASITFKNVVLATDMAPNQCTCGKTVLRQFALRLAKPHIKNEALTRQWLEDWDIIERRVQEKKAA